MNLNPFRTVGSISPSLGELHHLKYLDLSGNYFTHTPSIPPFIASLTFLTHLDLSFCSFGGNIPPQLGNLLFLQYLDLRSNEFDPPQQIPSQFSNLSHLVYLDLSFSNLVGGFPLQVTNMSSLTYLDLSDNNFNGTLPPQLGNLLSLEHLDLSANAFTGTIPSQFKNLSRLQHLDLHPEYYALDKTMSLSSDLQWLSELSTMRYLSLPRVNLSGASNWQQQVSSLSHLQYLDLNACNLVDSMPTLSPANFSTSLSYVDISNNSLRDASFIFPWLMNSTRSLVTLRMNDNGLTGTIPGTFGNFCNLAELYLSKNKLTGEFHEYIRVFSRCAHRPLKFLDLSWNEITGVVPDISHLSSLQELLLDNNRLNGTIPEAIGELSSLEYLNLASNQLEGQIPISLFHVCSLRELDLSGNRLSGQFHEFAKALSNCNHKQLQTLKMGWNEIIGMVPDLSSFSSLQVLRLDSNGLNGTLHEGIGQLSNLRELRLGNNSLEGLISESHFSKLSMLLTLDLSHNSLVFNISNEWVPPFKLIKIKLASCILGPDFPKWLQSQHNMNWLDISGAEISSNVPNWFWEFLPTMVKLNLSHNHFKGKIENLPLIPQSALQIDLSSNSFEGPVPAFLSISAQVFLSNNMFSTANLFLCSNVSANTEYLDFQIITLEDSSQIVG
ncbi:hypothetical protein AAHE18_04G210500 [Arachis hypogaea]